MVNHIFMFINRKVADQNAKFFIQNKLLLYIVIILTIPTTSFSQLTSFSKIVQQLNVTQQI